MRRRATSDSALVSTMLPSRRWGSIRPILPWKRDPTT
jgi:hypothetical protein